MPFDNDSRAFLEQVSSLVCREAVESLVPDLSAHPSYQISSRRATIPLSAHPLPATGSATQAASRKHTRNLSKAPTVRDSEVIS